MRRNLGCFFPPEKPATSMQVCFTLPLKGWVDDCVVWCSGALEEMQVENSHGTRFSPRGQAPKDVVKREKNCRRETVVAQRLSSLPPGVSPRPPSPPRTSHLTSHPRPPTFTSGLSLCLSDAGKNPSRLLHLTSPNIKESKALQTESISLLRVGDTNHRPSDIRHTRRRSNLRTASNQAEYRKHGPHHQQQVRGRSRTWNDEPAFGCLALMEGVGQQRRAVFLSGSVCLFFGNWQLQQDCRVLVVVQCCPERRGTTPRTILEQVQPIQACARTPHSVSE